MSIFTDIWAFLTGETGPYWALGAWRYPFVALFLALLAGGIAIAIWNWREDPSQRTATHVGTCAARMLIGCMWFEGMLWKMPLPVSGGLRDWVEQLGTRAAFEFHRELASGFLLPNLHWFGPFVFLAELMFSASLILGLGVRFAGVIGILFVLHLWIGIYLPGDPPEWSWTYIFLAMLMFLFALYAAGRSLGLDAWLRRDVPAVREGSGFLGRLLHAAG